MPKLDQFSQEMKQNIQEFERILSESSSDPELPPQVEKKLLKMETTITKAKAATVDCNHVDKKLRQLADPTEHEANFHMKHSAFLYQLAFQTTPKSLHCLSMRLTVKYFKTSPIDANQSDSLTNPELWQNGQAGGKQVFHVFTNTYKDATLQVLNIKDLNLLEGVFSDWHYALPKIFPTLKKIVVLDDDIVVQRDLSELWSLDMGGKVIGAMEFCAVKLGAIKSYLWNEKYDANSCTWMSGLNIIDLGRWRKERLLEAIKVW
ncbi:probable galacturonosyltransferase 7 isoform X1 [Tanacetum coccineum]